nr:hypothetical protein [Nocardia cyriacigeorgica]
MATPVAPEPTTTWSGLTPSLSAMTAGRRVGRNSGYLFARPTSR